MLLTLDPESSNVKWSCQIEELLERRTAERQRLPAQAGAGKSDRLLPETLTISASWSDMTRINHLAVIGAVVIHQALGFLWYGFLFFDQYLAERGKRPDAINPQDFTPYVLDILTWLIGTYTVAWLVQKTNSATAKEGALLGAILWIGVAVPALIPHYSFAGLSGLVMAIDGANTLASLIIIGALLAGWRQRSTA